MTLDDESGGIEVKISPKPGQKLNVTDAARLDILVNMLRALGMYLIESIHDDGAYTMRLKYEAGEVEP